MPRIVLISDTHGFHDRIPQIPDGDILIHAGDVTRKGRLAELADIDLFFKSLPHQHKILIAGNHDFCFENSRERSTVMLPSVLYLQDSGAQIMGLKIYGSPWQPRFFDWAFNVDRGAQLAAIWAKIPDDTDILVTHGPPLGIGDMVKSNKFHAGCEDLLSRVSLIKPKLHLFGHIHEGYGVFAQGGTTFVNASICDEAYQPINEAVVIDL